MQSNLWTSPKVVRIMSATKTDKCRVVGALFRVWCLFDEHTEDGHLDGYSFFVLDDELRIDGFSQAMSDVGWLIDVDGESLQVPDFDDHMSESAKKRAQDNKRKRIARKVSADKADKERTREEKRREENSKDKKGGEKTKRFSPPLISEVKNYCDQRGNNVDPESFINHYQSKGWMIGKNKMKCWMSAVRTWEKNSATNSGNNKRFNASTAIASAAIGSYDPADTF